MANSTIQNELNFPADVCNVKARITYRSDNVSSKHPVCLLVAEDLHHAISVRIGFGSAVSCKGELANSVGNSLLTQSHDSNQEKIGLRIPLFFQAVRTLTKLPIKTIGSLNVEQIKGEFKTKL